MLGHYTLTYLCDYIFLYRWISNLGTLFYTALRCEKCYRIGPCSDGSCFPLKMRLKKTIKKRDIVRRSLFFFFFFYELIHFGSLSFNFFSSSSSRLRKQQTWTKISLQYKVLCRFFQLNKTFFTSIKIGQG